jgi:hypothetical protein
MPGLFPPEDGNVATVLKSNPPAAYRVGWDS